MERWTWPFILQQVVMGLLWAWVSWAFWRTAREMREFEEEEEHE